MRRFLFINTIALVAIGSVAQISANAAEFKLQKPQKKGDLQVIFIDGDIEKGDFDKFKKLVLDNKLPVGGVIVSLDSRGGAMVDAANIGIAIRNMKWWTAARELCASACADIWVAGVKRGVYKETALGFHAVYTTNKDGKNEVDSSGNALTGAYYSKLGLSYDAIDYLTSAPPDGMEWLNNEKAKKYNINYDYLGSLPGKKAQTAPPQNQEGPDPEKPKPTQDPPKPGYSGKQHFGISIGFGGFRISFGLGGGGRRYVSRPHASGPRHPAPSRSVARSAPAKSAPSTSTSSSGGWSAVKGNS
jgi:hypothetical protein